MVKPSTLVTRKSHFHFRIYLTSDARLADTSPRLILFIVGLGIPILTTLLTYFPFCNRLIAKVKPYAIYPAIFRGHNVQAVARWLHFPTSGQTIYIALFTILNIVLSAVGYISVQPNTWWENLKTEMLSKVGARTGVLAMGLAPLVILTAGRNSVLLWITNWSHSTYILLHRWIARLFGIQIIVHSITELVQYVDIGTYSDELKEEYWIWGCVATVACSIMLIISVFRASAYEWFLVTHIILAVIVLVGTWIHLDELFEDRWGYKYWLYACFAIWGFDRLIRIVRVLKNGMSSTTFRPVGDEILRVDIKGLKWSTSPGQHAYVYFPMLRKLTPWENHPFSVIPTHFLRPISKSPASSNRGQSDNTPADTPGQEKDAEHLTPSSTNTLEHGNGPVNGDGNGNAHHSVDGITFFIKKKSGLTRHLWSTSLTTTTLVEGPYTGTSSRPVLLCDRLILIAGGIGITAVFPFVPSHSNVKIYWSMRANQSGMSNEISPALKGVENDIVTGGRLDLEGLLNKEAAGGWKDLGVVVCGPGGMCDDVRQLVVRISKERKVNIELDVEAFAW